MPRWMRLWIWSSARRTSRPKPFTAWPCDVATLNTQVPNVNAAPGKNRFVPLMMAALLAWGLFLAAGTFLYRINQEGAAVEGSHLPIYRGLIVLGCTLGFLSLWGIAIALRKRRNP